MQEFLCGKAESDELVNAFKNQKLLLIFRHSILVFVGVIEPKDEQIDAVIFNKISGMFFYLKQHMRQLEDLIADLELLLAQTF